MLDIDVNFKSNEELENKIYNSSLNYTRINVIDWMYGTMPMMCYLMDVDLNHIIKAFRLVILNSKLDKDLIDWLNNNLDVILKRHYDILLRTDPRLKKVVK